jgi:hypothetical protein
MVKNEWNYTTPSPYAINGVDRDKFTFKCAYLYRQRYSKCARDDSHCKGCSVVHYALFYSRVQ